MGSNKDKSEKAQRIMEELRGQAGPQSIPPPSDGEDCAAAMLCRIEGRQVKVVGAVCEALGTVSEIVDELRDSIDEDERVRATVRESARESRRTRREMRVLNYAMAAVVLITCATVVVLTAWQMRLVQDVGKQVSRMMAELRTVDSNMARTQAVILKQAEAHAKRIEAESAMTPQAEEEALEAAIDVQAEVAEAQIDTAHARKEAPPAGARQALQEARTKKARLRNSPPSVMSAY